MKPFGKKSMSNEIFEKYGTDPIALCREWYEDAIKTEPNDPEAICLATATKEGIPSNRWVLIKDISEKGFKFHTNAESQKGREIEENPHGAINWYWKTQRKQIRITGRIEQVDDAESDQYFTTRPIERQIGAWASKQSAPFEKREEMEAAIKKYEDEFAGVDNIPRPGYWRGYRLIPDRMEFWIAHRDRLHTRFVYTKKGDEWDATWLCP